VEAGCFEKSEVIYGVKDKSTSKLEQHLKSQHFELWDSLQAKKVTKTGPMDKSVVRTDPSVEALCKMVVFDMHELSIVESPRFRAYQRSLKTGAQKMSSEQLVVHLTM
jgi:hypothetical protein